MLTKITHNKKIKIKRTKKMKNFRMYKKVKRKVINNKIQSNNKKSNISKNKLKNLMNIKIKMVYQWHSK